MNSLIFPYKGWWDYLEKHSQDDELSKTELLELKADYKRLSNKFLKRRTRFYKKHLSIALEKEEFNQLKRRAEENEVSITDFVRNASLNINPQLFPQQKLLQIEEKILFLIDSIEEYQENLNETPDSLIAIKNKLIELDVEFQILTYYGN